jgi:hypothetical protein
MKLAIQMELKCPNSKRTTKKENGNKFKTLYSIKKNDLKSLVAQLTLVKRRNGDGSPAHGLLVEASNRRRGLTAA